VGRIPENDADPQKSYWGGRDGLSTDILAHPSEIALELSTALWAGARRHAAATDIAVCSQLAKEPRTPSALILTVSQIVLLC